MIVKKEYQKKYRIKNRAKLRAYQREYEKEYRKTEKAKARDRRYRISEKGRKMMARSRKKRNLEYRRKCISAYGGKCLCCGESILEFLAIDHMNGNGNKHRKENRISAGSSTHYWLVRNNFPEGFRVLCHNCNMAHGAYGYCPHARAG